MENYSFHFGGKRALVTGAGKGIGRDVALRLAKCGATVYAVSRTSSDLTALADESRSLGYSGLIKPLPLDITDVSAVDEAFKSLQPIDMLVNNAGQSVLDKFVDVKLDDYDRVMALNVRATLHVGQLVARSLIARRCPGSIVNLSSQASLVAIAKHTVYSVSKAAVDMLTKSMAFELGPHQIRVNAVHPTVVLTDMGRMAWSDPAVGGPMLAQIPLGRFAEVGDVSGAVLFLLSDAAAMINGVLLPIDGGFTLH